MKIGGAMDAAKCSRESGPELRAESDSKGIEGLWKMDLKPSQGRQRPSGPDPNISSSIKERPPGCSPPLCIESPSTPSDAETSPTEPRIRRIVDEPKVKQTLRGRTMERGPRLKDPLARATSRTKILDTPIEVDMRPIQKRISRSSTFFEDPTDPRAILEDALLEPLPNESLSSSMSSVSERLRSSASLPGSPASSPVSSRAPRAYTSPIMGLNEDRISVAERPPNPLQTVFNDRPALCPVPKVSSEKLAQAMPDLDRLEYLAVKSSTPLWSLPHKFSQNFDSRPIASAAARLPNELLHKIYEVLSPVDFNAARHTCRNWFNSSLKQSLLETMLRRGGWSSSVDSVVLSDHYVNAGFRMPVDVEWSLSKRLARECALGPNWTGNGLTESYDLQSSASSKQDASHSLFQSAVVDFNDIAIHHPGAEVPGITFTVSNCGIFLMVANGCLIYIYELNRSHRCIDSVSAIRAGSLRPVTSIIAPRRVLACSMDTSSDRYAIAALLDGRMGLVCDISSQNIANRRNLSHQADIKLPSDARDGLANNAKDQNFQRTSMLERFSLQTRVARISDGRSTTPSSIFPGIFTVGTNTKTHSPAILEKDVGNWQESLPRDHLSCSYDSSGPECSVSSKGAHNKRCLSRDLLPWETRHGCEMPVEDGPRSIYRNLCSDDDPPRSVAVCPQRRCIAFGCAAGIELHWVDALSGQDLSRWFPLAAPSDYLFFLPPRRSVDSAKKLRLISSAARPGERAAIGHRSFGERPRLSPFWEKWGRTAKQDFTDQSQGSAKVRRQSSPRTASSWRNCSDHYRAVPLSDGYHILFTDPVTGFLCLGSDAPIGGPTKLLRKIWFKGPDDNTSPVSYASGSDLRHGVRVVAAYGAAEEQTLWLFSVPGDVFNADPQAQFTAAAGTLWLRPISDQRSANMDWVPWWPDQTIQNCAGTEHDSALGTPSRNLWPTEVRGQRIGSCKGLIDLSIDSGPEMAIWAFSKEGQAKVWQINAGKHEATRKSIVTRDGMIRDLDTDGDIIMCDAPPATLSPELWYADESFKQDSTEASLTPEDLVHNSFDGTSFPDLPAKSRLHHFIGGSIDCHPQAEVDWDGDVLMDDLPDVQGFVNGEDADDSLETVAFAHHKGEVLYPTDWRVDHTSRSKIQGTVGDIVEELTGIARIDIEVR